MTAAAVKTAIRNKKKFDIDFLHTLASKSGIGFGTVVFWWNAIKN
jgi:hypothetical protein